ncbi:hypothetical protein [Caballeronia sordidicola]|uniref:hypothetical protein n=1 Tax=Caballeronia sordidicola TaxID=196367 RepID=UPI0015C50636|nr:hypothetical protein [Caballeronia sordidicola]
MRQLSKQATWIQVRANDRVFVAGGTLRGLFALVAHTLRQHAIGTSTGCPYAWSLAMAIPSQAIRWYGAFVLQLVKCMIRHQHCTSWGEAVHRDAGHTSHTVEGRGRRSLGIWESAMLPVFGNSSAGFAGDVAPGIGREAAEASRSGAAWESGITPGVEPGNDSRSNSGASVEFI